jgi:uncharacterized repeat protein (TIGR01451 family)/fimbrial isopeptide formation D2 family protein
MNGLHGFLSLSRGLSRRSSSPTGSAARRRTSRRELHAEWLERRLALAATPTASVDAPNGFIGSEIPISVSFDNTAANPADIGYGPFIDVIMPASGDAPPTPANGISYKPGSATYAGIALAPTVLTFGPSGQVNHPFAKDAFGNPVVISGGVGDQLLVFQLPFGSYGPAQPPATVNFVGTVSGLAQPGNDYDITATGGFQYQLDGSGNPTVDEADFGATATDPVAPQLFTLTKDSSAPEDETATGPNFQHTYTVTVSVAPGQTLENFTVTDVLPGNVQFVAVTSATANGATVITPTSTPSTTVPGGTLAYAFDQVLGTGGADVTITYTFFMPEYAAGGADVIPLETGGTAAATNTVGASGTWQNTNPNFPPEQFVVGDPVSYTVTGKTLALQKSASPSANARAGDTVTYTLSFQLSDYFALGNFVIDDILSDGQNFDTSFTPTLSFTQKGQTFTGTFGAGNFTVDDTLVNGTTTVDFDVAAQLAALGLPTGTKIVGAGIPNAGTGGPDPDPLPTDPGTTGTITFKTIIRNTYRATGDEVVQGDVIGNTATTGGTVLDFTDLDPTTSTFSDGSSASVTLATGALQKTVHAVNGLLVTGTPVVAPGDTVTFRLTYNLPFSSIGSYVLTDYLPLPIFEASALSFAGGPSATLPGAGQWSFGPLDTFSQPDPPDVGGPTPTFSFSTAANSLSWDFGTFQDDENRSAVTDIFFTVTATARPFADGLFLTNQGVQTEVTSQGQTLSQNDIAQVQVAEPLLGITKGVVATNDGSGVFTPTPYAPAGVTFSAPGSSPSFTGTVTSNGLATTPIVAALSNVGANDLVTFAIVIENTGRSPDGAFDVIFRDTFDSTKFQLPAGGLNLQIRDGAGTLLPFTTLGTGLFDAAGGIQLDDGAGVGSLGPGKTTGGTVINTGTNIAVITYDLQLKPNVQPSDVATNTATLSNYASQEGGPNFIPAGLQDSTTVTVAAPTVVKALVSTSIVNANNSNTQAVIGELATYTITVTVPQGTMPTAQVVDSMPSGLAYVRTISAVNNNLATLTIPNLANLPTVTSNGQTITYDLGTIVNADTDPTTAETFTITIEAVVLNVTGNVRGTSLVNQARTTWNAGANQTSNVSSGAVTVIEPTLTVTKTASPTTGQAADTITYTIVVANPTGTNRTDAYEVTLQDLVPTGMTYVAGSWQNTAGTAPTTISDAGAPTLTAGWNTFALGDTSTFTFQATLNLAVTPAQQIVNEADAAWESLPTDPGQISTFNTNSYERTGSGSTTLGQLNNYTASDDATVTIVSPTIAKALVSTSIDNANNTRTQAVIGETALYRLTITVPQGTVPTSTIVDTLPAGLAFVAVVGTPVVDPDITIQNADWFTTPGNLTVGTGGQLLTFNLGNVTNSNTDSGTAETIVVDIRAVVLNLTGNTSGTTLVNQAQAFWNAGANSTALVSAETVTVIEPDMEVDKTVSVGGGGGNVGDTVTYTIVIRQAAGSETDAFNVTLADTIPAQITAPTLTSVVDTSGLVTAANFSLTGSSLTTTGTGFSFAKIPGRTITLTVTGTIANTITPAQTITNTAAIQWTSLDGNPGKISAFNDNSYERTGSGSTTLGQLNDYAASDAASFTTRSADLVVTKTVSNATPNVGDTITYLITVTNNGPDAATGVRMTDTFPTAGLDFVDADPSQGSYNAGTGIWEVGSLASGASATLEITAEVLPPPTPGVAPPTQTNVAVVTGNEPDPDPDNNRAEVDETPQYADLAVTKTVDVARPNVGANVVFTITVQNLGADAATNVRLSDPLPSGLQLVSATASQGSYTPGTTSFGTGIWTVGTLSATAPGNTATLTIVATVLPPPSGGPPPAKTNVAAVSHSDQYDPNPGNNQDDVTVTPLYADVSVLKTVSDPAPYLGDTITYTIVVSNAGPDPAQTVSVAEAFPTAGLSNIVAGTPTLGEVTGSGGSFTWAVGTLPSGQAATLTFTARTTAVGNFVNTVTASSTTYDPDAGDLTDEAEIDTQTGGVITGTDFSCESGPIVRVVDPRDGRLRSEFFAYEPSFRGGVRVYGADITGDGVAEILTAPGPGRPGEVRVFTREGVPLPQYNFMPFGAGFTSGVEVAAGSVTGTGRYEIVASQSRGQGLVRVFTVNAGSVNSSPIRQFQPFGSRFRGGVTVATADVGTFSGANFVSNAPNGIAEIIVGSGAGIPAEVRAYNAVPATPARIGAFRVMGGSNRGVSVSKLPGATGVADRVLVAGGQRSGGQVETWRQNGGQFVRDAAFAGFGGTSASVFAAALDAENIFTVEGVGGRTSGVRKNTSPSGGTSSAVPGTSTFRPPLRVAALRR